MNLGIGRWRRPSGEPPPLECQNYNEVSLAQFHNTRTCNDRTPDDRTNSHHFFLRKQSFHMLRNLYIFGRYLQDKLHFEHVYGEHRSQLVLIVGPRASLLHAILMYVH